MSKRVDLYTLMTEYRYSDLNLRIAGMTIDAAKEEALAEIQAELDARLAAPGLPPSGASGTPEPTRAPAPMPCPPPFSWCACCGHPAKPGEPCPAQFDDTHIAIGDPYISCPPYNGGPTPSPDTAPAAEPPQAPGGLDPGPAGEARLDALRWWLKANDDTAEVNRLRAALREIRDSPTKLAASNGITLIRMRRIAVEALDK